MNSDGIVESMEAAALRAQLVAARCRWACLQVAGLVEVLAVVDLEIACRACASVARLR